jgi:carboxypeptidase-like protein/type IX secretion system substrate protein
MSKKIQLQIPKPCHEDWNKMTQVQQGRFCNSCEKQVVDFTGMNDEQVLAFFRKPSIGSVCGRFLNDQLNREIIIPKKRIPWLKYFFQFALPIFLTSLKSSAQGNVVIKEKITTNCSQRTLGMVAPTKLRQKEIINEIKGRVIDEKGAGIPFASVMINGSQEGLACDSLGNFALRIKYIDELITINASSVGFENSSITVSLGNNSSRNNLVIVLSVAPSPSLGELVIKSEIRTTVGKLMTGSVASVKKSWQIIKPKVETNIDPSMKLFPNPLRSSQTLNISFVSKKEERVQINLFTLEGKLIKSRIVLTIKGENKFQFQDEAKLPAATYLVQVMNKSGAVIFSEKFVIR